jgi:hypothetical protein
VQCDPEGAIRGSEPGPGSRLCVDGELLAKDQLDQRLLASASEERKKGVDEGRSKGEQGVHGD